MWRKIICTIFICNETGHLIEKNNIKASKREQQQLSHHKTCHIFSLFKRQRWKEKRKIYMISKQKIMKVLTEREQKQAAGHTQELDVEIEKYRSKVYQWKTGSKIIRFAHLTCTSLLHMLLLEWPQWNGQKYLNFYPEYTYLRCFKRSATVLNNWIFWKSVDHYFGCKFFSIHVKIANLRGPNIVLFVGWL